MKKKGAISMEYLVAIIIALVVMGVLIWLFTTKSHDSGGKISDVLDGDGDFDIVPYYNGDGAYSFTENERFISNLYWENTGGQFVRRELD